MILKSFAKINLSIQITGKDENGYHLLDMVELPIDLHDVLEVNKNISGRVSHITCDELKLAHFKDNLCKTALDLMRNEFNFTDQYDIFIHKVIPFAAGLGGGSANTASTLKAINVLSKLGQTDEQLKALGLKIGADVPFFFLNKPARVSGIGEKINPLPPIKDFYAVLIKPEKGCSTSQIYSICDKYKRQPINNELVIKGLIEGDEDLIAANIGNDLMEPAMETNDEIAPTIEVLKSFGFKIVSMSGSGATCFALSTNRRKCVSACKKLRRKGYNAYASKVLR